jgi:hypothetical protein
MDLISVATGAVLTLFSQYLIKRWDENKHTHYLALQLIFHFKSVANLLYYSGVLVSKHSA